MASLALFLDGTIGLAAEQRKLADALVSASAGKLTTRPPVDNLKGMRAALETGDDHLLYFFCHGRSALPFDDWLVHLRRIVKKKGSSPSLGPLASMLDGAVLDGSDTALKLTKNVISLNELLAIRNTMKNEPIVFLNMCESAQVLPDVSDSFVSFFLNRYAGAVLGTECPVPPDFASAFAREILPRLLAGAPVGRTLVRARRRMFDEHRNPLGLAYSLWGSTTATCVPEAFGEDVAETFALPGAVPASLATEASSPPARGGSNA